jgi:excisionase family DNA binding protein
VSDQHYSDKVVSLREVAAIANLSVTTLRSCIKRGEIKAVRPCLRKIGVRISEIERWLKSREAA